MLLFLIITWACQSIKWNHFDVWLLGMISSNSSAISDKENVSQFFPRGCMLETWINPPRYSGFLLKRQFHNQFASGFFISHPWPITSPSLSYLLNFRSVNQTNFIILDDMTHDATAFHNFCVRVMEGIKQHFIQLRNIDHARNGIIRTLITLPIHSTIMTT